MEYGKEKIKMLYDIYRIIDINYEFKDKLLDFIYELEVYWNDEIEKENQIKYYNDVY